MAADVRTFIAACTDCALSNSTHQAPSSLLQPLPIPSRPWSHIAVDWTVVTGLPPSEGNTILTIVDRFSKAVHFVPLPKLPTALETANLLVQHLFRLDGIPQLPDQLGHRHVTIHGGVGLPTPPVFQPGF